MSSPSIRPSGPHNVYSLLVGRGSCTAVYLSTSRWRCGGRKGRSSSWNSLGSGNSARITLRHICASGGTRDSAECCAPCVAVAEGRPANSVGTLRTGTSLEPKLQGMYENTSDRASRRNAMVILF